MFHYSYNSFIPFSQIWLVGGKAAAVEYWSKEVEKHNVDETMTYDSGRGIILLDSTKPFDGDRYLPRMFKVVSGDNSIDIYTNDIVRVVITNDKGKLEGFNVIEWVEYTRKKILLRVL